MAQYPNSGKLSANRYKDAPNKPDMVGELTMDRSALKQLMEQHDMDDIVIKLGAWKMTGQYGEWLRMSWNNYTPKPKDNPYVPPKPAAAPKQPDVLDDDSIPF
jgi:hypothetical protein